MSYQSLTKEKKTSIELPDVAFQSSSLSQLIELNHTRRIVLLLTGIQFIIPLCTIVGIICARLFGYELVGEWSHPLVQSIPLLSCVCFLIGSLAAERYHVKGLLLFVRLTMVYIIIACIIITTYVAIPICWKRYPTSILAKIIFGIIYHAIFCAASLIPGYTINMAKKLSQLIMDNNFCPIK